MRAGDSLASGAVALVLISSLLAFATPVTSDPDVVDNGDFTKSVIWNLTNPEDYHLVNTTILNGSASLQLVNETVVDNSTAQYLMGTGSNIDLAEVQDAISIENTSLPIYTLSLQPGPEAKDCYIDEWFPEFNPEGTELVLSSEYDPVPFSSERCRIVMELNLSMLPPDAKILNATLLLYQKQAKLPPLNYTIHALTRNWTETGVTWKTYDLASNGYWHTVGGDFSAEFFAEGVIDNTLGWKSFDLTRLVDLWMRGKIPNYGFIIVPSIETIDNAKTFSSSDIANKPEQRPRIVLNYTLGEAVGSYESAVIGPGTNSTFTLASWQTGLLSKATDEFDSGALSSRWAWMNDPSAAGGSANFDTPGWLNVTGSPSTTIADPPGGCNFLYQTVEGDFAAETSLRAYLGADGMGAGLLIRADRISWLAVYLTRSNGSGCIMAEARNGNVSSLLAAVPWLDDAAFLRMERADGTYHMSASADGLEWSPLASYAPLYDFPSIVAAGLCVFSGGFLLSPVSEFDYFRTMPMGQAPALEMRVRTGNSTDLADPSWGPWGAPVEPADGTVINSTGRYVQYQVRLSTAWSWLSPLFLGFECHAEHYLSEGAVTTGNVYQLDLESWQRMVVSQSTEGGVIEYSYSTDLGNSWTVLGPGSDFALAETERSMMVRASLRTFDTLTTPTIDFIQLIYSLSVVSFRVVAPASVTAGQTFSVTIEALSPSGDVATAWNGTVTLEATDADGTHGASGTLHVTSVVVPLGGTATIPNQRYDVAETIRIRASAGDVSGLSAPVLVRPGPIASLSLEPDNTTMFEYTSEVFTATPLDAFGNLITDQPILWSAEPGLGDLNTTAGSTVRLTVGRAYTGGYLNVSCAGMSVSRWIDVVPMRFPPYFTSPLPEQVRDEDAADWTLDLSEYVGDIEDPLTQLRWYATNESLVTLHGENRTGNLVMTFSTVPNAHGSGDLRVYVVDSDGMKGMAVLRVTLLPVNDPPSIDLIDPLTVCHSLPYVYDLTHYVHDPDNSDSELTLSVDTASLPFVRVNSLLITLTYPSSMMGTSNTVVITVRDPAGATSATAVLVRVTEDHPPVQTGMLPSVELDMGETVEACEDLADYFVDPDGDMLTFEALCEHSTVIIRSDRSMDVSAPKDWYGVEYAIVRAIDSQGARAEGVMRITVSQVNQPPVISGVPDLKVRYETRYDFDLSPYIRDAEMDSEQLTLTSSDPHCTFSGFVMTAFYPESMNGTVNPVTITLSDGVYNASCTINITVTANYPPSLLPWKPLPDHSFLEDVPTSYPVGEGLEGYFMDEEDGQLLAFVAFSLSPNVTAEAVEGVGSSWTVAFETTPDHNGMSTVVIRAVDSEGALVERAITLDVVPVPDAPTLDLPLVFDVVEGQQVIMELQQYVTDPDSSFANHDFVFTVTAAGATAGCLQYIEVLPSLLVFDFPTGFVGDTDEKTFQIWVTVTDQDGKSTTSAMSVVVKKAPVVKDDQLLLAAMLVSGAVAVGLVALAVAFRKKPFVIMDMMLVHNDGFLIGRHAEHHADGEIDQDILSGMLTAVLNFVEDSMAPTHDQLKTFGFRDYQVVVKRGTKSYAAIVFEGDLPDNMDKALGDFLATFERIYRKKLESWTGDFESDFAGVEVLIGGFVKEHGKGRKSSKGRSWRASATKAEERPKAEQGAK